MIEVGENFRGKDAEIIEGANWCLACNKEKETTEHVIQCPAYKKMTGHRVLTHQGCFEETEWLCNASQAFENIEATRKILVKAKTNKIQMQSAC